MTEQATVELKIGARVVITDIKVDKDLSIILSRYGLGVGSGGIVQKIIAKVCNVKFDPNEVTHKPFYQIIPTRCLGVK